jgi:hypothetical protein
MPISPLLSQSGRDWAASSTVPIVPIVPPDFPHFPDDNDVRLVSSLYEISILGTIGTIGTVLYIPSYNHDHTLRLQNSAISAKINCTTPNGTVGTVDVTRGVDLQGGPTGCHYKT